MLASLKSLLLRELQRRGYCVSYGEPATFESIVASFGGHTKDFYFIQVGAYDGRESDPIWNYVHRYGWSGLLVEPQREIFERLKFNYAGIPRLLFECTAIADHEGSLPFYKLKDEYAHLFHGDHRTISSFYPEHITRHLSAPVDAATVLQRTDTKCVTLSSLVEKHHVAKIDLLQVDVEGYDYQIVRNIDFEKVIPSIIRFEHANITPGEKSECIDLLISKGYKLVIGAYDTTAFRSKSMYD
jgi:FkbM family methyltransferase